MFNKLKTVILLGALTGLLLLVGQLIGGTQGLTIALVFSILMNFGTYFFSHKIVLMIYRAKPARKADYPHLHKTIEEIAKQAGIPKPSVYIVPSAQSNAFACGRNPKHAVVACTEGILNLLTKEELKGVLAHEISHVKNRDILISTIAATIAGVISYVAFMARWAAIFGGFGGRDRDSGNLLGLLFLAIVTPIVAMILQLAISRSREYLADASGARLLKNAQGLASALEKLEGDTKKNPMRLGNPSTAHLFISNPFKLHGFTRLFSTHPATSLRVKKLREMEI